MLEISTLARPYAKAVFEFAKKDANLNKWSEFLLALDTIVTDGQLSAYLDNPNLPGTEKAKLLLSISEKWNFNEGENLIKLLVSNKRIALIPYICEQYEKLKSEEENKLHVAVSTAFEATESDKKILNDCLKDRFKKSVDITYQVKPELIGGVLINVNDRIIDASLLGQLNKLNLSLRA